MLFDPVRSPACRPSDAYCNEQVRDSALPSLVPIAALTGLAQQAELHGEAQAVGVAAPLAERIKRRGMCQSSVRRYW